MKTVDMFITGVVGIGIVTAFALHAADLSKLVSSSGTAASGLINTAEKGLN
jgi:hypothetical protein